MSTVRTVVHPGWIAVSGPGLDAVVAAPDRHAPALEAAARDGLLALLEALTADGLSAAPDLVACAPNGTGLRVVVRGAAVAVLPDGTRVGSGGRMPWADVDVDVDVDVAEGEVVLEAPEPQPPRGWRRPARLSRGADENPETPAPEAPAPEAPAPEADSAQPVPAPPPDLTLPPPEDAVGLPPVARVPAPAASRHGLIDSVPWRRPGSGPAPTAEEGPPAPAPTELLPVVEPDEATAEDGEGAAPHGAVPASGVGTVEVPGPTAVMPPASEHVQPEVTTSRGALPRSDDDLDRPVVLAVLCPAGHPSPPHAGSCRTCGREIPPQQPFPTARPSLGVLRISTGGSVPLDRGVLLGRAPRVNEELPASQRPHLLRVGGADRDISRNHAEIVLEGWHVLVRDLGSTNGTTVALPGQEPVRLRPTEDQGIEPGTVVTLADEVVLTYEVQE